MNDKQQTAVQWLENQLKTRPKPLDNSQIDKLFEQALAMEREQIIDAHYEGQCHGFSGYQKYIIEKLYTAQYFTDTYQTEP